MSPEVLKQKQIFRESEETSKNHLELLHLQDLMRLIRRTAHKMKGKEPRKVMKAIETKVKIADPLLRAIVRAILNGSEDGRFYKVINDPIICDLKFCFIGPNFQPVAKAPHNLITKDVYHEKCKSCSKNIPIIQIHLNVVIKRKTYRALGEEFQEVSETRIGFLAIECGKLKVGGEITYEDLLRR